MIPLHCLHMLLRHFDSIDALVSSRLMRKRPWLEPALTQLLCDLLDGELPPSPRDDLSLPYVLNFATDDLKAYYFEALTAQPGQGGLSSKAVSDWFWGQTVAGKVLLEKKDRFSKSEDKLMRRLVKKNIVPRDQQDPSRKPARKIQTSR